MKGDKRRARHSLAGSPILSRDHSSHLPPYLKPTQGCQKTCKLPTTTWNKTHTLPVTAAGRAGGTCTSLVLPHCFPLTVPAAWGPGTGCCLCPWLALLIPQVLTQIGSQKNTGVLPVILCHGSLLIFFGELTTLSHYFTFYCGLS